MQTHNLYRVSSNKKCISRFCLPLFAVNPVRLFLFIVGFCLSRVGRLFCAAVGSITIYKQTDTTQDSRQDREKREAAEAKFVSTNCFTAGFRCTRNADWCRVQCSIRWPICRFLGDSETTVKISSFSWNAVHLSAALDSQAADWLNYWHLFA